CPALQRDQALVGTLVAGGILCSLTAGSFAGHFGRPVRAFSQKLLADGLVHDIASDAHDLDRRPPAIGPVLAAEGFTDDMIDHYARAAPLAILQGTPIPPAPAPPPKRGLLARLRPAS